MFYRLHVSILKLLLKGDHCEEYHHYAQYIEEAANSPFAKGCEKKDEESGKYAKSVYLFIFLLYYKRGLIVCPTKIYLLMKMLFLQIHYILIIYF